ncbi:MAG: hypothetical protein V7788_10255 [Alphaproteobacteria bacterium]|jgi:uncharacterized membrane protein
MAKRELSDRHREQRGKNYAMAAVILGLIGVFYLVFIARAGLLG